MILNIGNILLIGSILLFISIIAGKTSYKFGVPTLVLFLIIGMLAGSEGLGGIYFDDPKIAQFIGVVALNFILFSGGLDTNWQITKPILWHGVTLSTLGVFLTAIGLGVFVYYVTDFTLYEGLLLGAIVSSTDAAAVFSILRSRSIALKKNLRATLEFESGSNDPMAYFLTIAFTALIVNKEMSMLSIIPLFIKQIIIGSVFGLLSGYLSRLIINGIKLDFEGLYPVLVIALMFFTFSFTDYIGGNGFLAIYLAAVYLGNQDIIHKKTIVKTFDGFSWLMQIVLFLTLGLLVFPSDIVPIIGVGLLISAFLIVVARPVSVFICLFLFKIKRKNLFFISWVGLRGAVPIVFATYPLIAGVEKSQMIFNIVFFISLSSVIIQGTSLAMVSKLLGVSIPEKVRAKTPLEVLLNDVVKSESIELLIDETSNAIGKKIVELNFPQTAIIAMIKRDNKFITPNGSTVIEDKDTLIIFAENKDTMEKVYDCFS